MLGLLSGLIQRSTDGWTAAPVAALAAGVIFFAAFAQRQRTEAVPLIKPSLLRNRGFTAGLILGLVFFAAVAGLLYAVSLFLQRGAGYSPERAPVTGFAPAAVGIVIASVACRNLLTRLGRRLSLAGIVVTVGGVALLATVVAPQNNRFRAPPATSTTPRPHVHIGGRALSPHRGLTTDVRFASGKELRGDDRLQSGTPLGGGERLRGVRERSTRRYERVQRHYTARSHVDRARIDLVHAPHHRDRQAFAPRE
jgi:hypothetical protein